MMKKIVSKFTLAILGVAFMLFLFDVQNAQAAKLRISNSYQYISDNGSAKFNIPWRDPTSGFFSGVQYDGNLTFWTNPGDNGELVDYSTSNVQKTTSVDGMGSIPAYSTVDGDQEIGKWILPTGIVSKSSGLDYVVLKLNNKNFTGVVRPLKISLSSKAPFSFATQLNSGIGTLYALSLSKAKDVLTDINSDQGTVDTKFDKGSYINSTTAPDPISGESKQGYVENEPKLVLVNDSDKNVSELPMEDANGVRVGKWFVKDNAVLWQLNENSLTGPVKKVNYRVIDERNNYWSGWWNQQPDYDGNVEAGSATYKSATITPKIGEVVVKYVDENGNNLRDSSKYWGIIGRNYSVKSKKISGYSLIKRLMPKNVVGNYNDSVIQVTYIYSKEPTPTPKYTYPKRYGNIKVGSVVYSTKHIYTYKNFVFKKNERRFSYDKKPRINRPMFVVKKIVKNQNGRVRFYVKDVNHLSSSYGKKGYITARKNYVVSVYYQSKAKMITIINPLGVNEYKNKNLTKKVKNLKQGTHLKVNRVVKHNLTTRYQLANGHYLTANRKLVIHGKYITLDGSKRKMPVTVKVTNKKGINLYRTGNFSKKAKVRHYKRGTILMVQRFEYTKPNSRQHFGVRRYVVKGGYITAHGNFVKVTKTR